MPQIGMLRSLLGTGAAGYANGDGTTAVFDAPWDVAISAEDDSLYVSDSTHDKIRLLRRTGGDPSLPASWRVTLLAGLGGTSATDGFVDGIYTSARFSRPTGLAVDLNGDLYVADENNGAIRVVSPSGVVTTLAGAGVSGFNDSTTGASAEFKRSI